MTEAEWEAGADPAAMMRFLWDGVSDRRLRLFALACCRAMTGGADSPLVTHAVEASESFADGAVSQDDLDAARGLVTAELGRAHMVGMANSNSPMGAALVAAYQVSRPRARKVVQEIGLLLRKEVGSLPRERQASIFRDVLGNPFRPVSLDPAWRTSVVLALAEGIYAGRAFDRLPILADALQDAGCVNADVLAHCRGPGPHARGCWVIDLILGKS